VKGAAKVVRKFRIINFSAKPVTFRFDRAVMESHGLKVGDRLVLGGVSGTCRRAHGLTWVTWVDGRHWWWVLGGASGAWRGAHGLMGVGGWK